MRDYCAEDFAKKVKEKFYPCRPSPPEKFEQMIDESIKNSEETICKGIIKDVKMQLGNSKMQDLEDNLTKATLKDEKSKIPMFLDKSGFKEIVEEAVKREINNPTRFNLPAIPVNPCKKNQKYSIYDFP